MRLLHIAAATAVSVLALYFAVTWGTDAARIFMSPAYGLDEFAHAQDVFSLGAALHLDAAGMFRAAAFLGAVKLVGAAVFALHLVDRAHALVTGRAPDDDVLEAAVLLVLLLHLALSLPAVMQHEPRLLQADGFMLLLAGLTAALNGAERLARGMRDTSPAPQTTPHGPAPAAPMPALPTLPRMPIPEPLRLIGAAVEPFFRLWTHDLRASAAGEPPRRA